MRPGYGMLHSTVGALLTESSPAEVAHVRWLEGAMRLRVSAHVGTRSDLDGWVESSRLLPVGEARAVVTVHCAALLLDAIG